MATRLTFWRFPEEEEAFIRFLQSTGPVMGVVKGKVDDRALLRPLPLADLIDRDPEQILIWLPDFLTVLPVQTYDDESGERYAVLFTRVPVLTYRRGRLRAPNRLGPSHISGDWKVLSSDKSKLLDQPEPFIRWGKKVLAWMRRQTPEWHQYKGYRVTRKVFEALKSGLEIVL